MDQILERLTEIEARLQKTEEKLRALEGVNSFVHPMTRAALIRHAPEMPQTEMDEVITKYWAIGQTYRNTKEYAIRRCAVLDENSHAIAARELFWLQRAKLVEYLKPMRAYTII